MTLLGARRVGPEGHVYAFEPLPDNVAKIGELMAANDIRNVQVVPAAVSASTGQTRLFATHNNKTPSLVRASRDGEGIDVSTVTLDEFAATHRPPTVVKIDVEGAEHLVFNGASRLLGSPHRVDWIVEIHDAQNEQSVTQSIGSNRYAIRNLPPPIARGETYPCHIVASRVEHGR
jgi:FkbM family methyltransferase